MVMCFHISSLLMAVLAVTSALSGFSHPPLGYSADFSAPPYLPYAAPSPAHFAAPLPVDFAGGSTYSDALPVAPLNVNSYAASSHHTYAASPTFFKHHSGYGPFTAYSALAPSVKFAGVSHNPSLYRGVLPYGISGPAVAYSGLGGGTNTVVRYGPPITTTTTTYSTAAAGAVGPVATPFAAHYAGRIGW